MPLKNETKTEGAASTGLPSSASTDVPPRFVSRMSAVSAYKSIENHYEQSKELSGIQKYKDDQLLSNPGGDHYYLDQKRVVAHPEGQESFWGRIGKDISDAFSNVKNGIQNFLFGAKIRYRDQENQIQEARQRGLVGSVVDFFKDLGSALSLGAWRPDGEKAPEGFTDRLKFAFSKMKEAFCGDLIQGVSGSVIHMGEDLIFAGWNLLEAIPDATLGNFEAGKRLTTAIFDNGQVVIDYLTDILPSGDAWQRVHAMSLKSLTPPVLNNLNRPEEDSSDARWRYVRNTPFRKTIETLGAILTDIFSLKILGQLNWSSHERHQRN